MARRKRASAAARAVPASPQLVPVASATPASSGRWVWLLIGLVVSFGAILAWRHANQLKQDRLDRQQAAASGPIGGVAQCRQLPQWLPTHASSPQANLSTSDRKRMGLLLVEPQRPPYQHPSWSKAGWLGPILILDTGDVLVAPVPKVNLIDNLPEAQNTLWRVDAVSELMSPLLQLPAAAPAPPDNPYGLLGLAMDCETGSVYASSVQGSDRSHERGRIFQIDPRKARVLARLDAVDAIGLVVFRGRAGKRLYYGSARSPEVFSVGLDAAGGFVGAARPEFSLEGLGARGDDRARRMRIETDGSMLVQGIEFSFNLVAPTEKQETAYRLRYDHGADRWRIRMIGEFEVND